MSTDPVKHRFSLMVALVFALALTCACRPTNPGATPTASSPTSIAVAATPPPATPKVVAPVAVVCPTDNEQAREAFNAAISFQQEGRLAEAEQSFRTAIDLDPQYCDAMDNLGLLLRSQDRVDEAIAWYQRSIEILPDNKAAHQNLAAAYVVLGQPEEALAEYKLIVRIYPDDPEGHYGLGNLYLGLDQAVQAIVQLRRAEALYQAMSSPLVTDAQYLLGVAYFRQENYFRAKDYFETVYTQLSDHPGANYFLGLCYLTPQLEDIGLARQYLLQARDLGVELPAEVLQAIGE